jgi:hypothetical protein
LPLTARAPEESTIRKLVRRLGPEMVAELTRVVIGRAHEADIRYPSDGGLAWQGTRMLARCWSQRSRSAAPSSWSRWWLGLVRE